MQEVSGILGSLLAILGPHLGVGHIYVFHWAQVGTSD